MYANIHTTILPQSIIIIYHQSHCIRVIISLYLPYYSYYLYYEVTQIIQHSDVIEYIYSING